MVLVRFAFRCHPGRAEDAVAALLPVVAASRALPGVISIDFGRDITDPDAFIATELYEDRAALDRQEALPETIAALDRQEALPETIAALAALKDGIIAESDALLHHVSTSERW
jgi:quinol monooxygenase YgiN